VEAALAKRRGSGKSALVAALPPGARAMATTVDTLAPTLVGN